MPRLNWEKLGFVRKEDKSMCYQLLTDKFSLKEINNFESFTLSDTCKNNVNILLFIKPIQLLSMI